MPLLYRISLGAALRRLGASSSGVPKTRPSSNLSTTTTTTGNESSGSCGRPLPSDSSMIAANHRLAKKNPSFATAHLESKHGSPSRNASLTLSTSRSFSAAPEAEGGPLMEDEYGEMTSDGDDYVHPTPFELECGIPLENATLRYNTYGELNEARDNAIVVCHALTGNSSLHTWWGDMLGPGRPFDTNKYFVVCANILGSCYGSTSPTSIMPGTNPPRPYGNEFPDISVKDTVQLQLRLIRDHLNIHSIKSVIGGSFGGMQAVEFAAQGGTIENNAEPFVRSVIPIACGAGHTAWQIGLSECQRQAIYADPKWNNGHVDPDDPPNSGLAVARQIGMVSYRTRHGYESKFGREIANQSSLNYPYGKAAQWQVKNYLEYQGHKFLGRFDAVTYVKMTEQMDSHDVGRNRGGKELALSEVKIPALVMGIDSDVLYPLEEQEELVKLFPNSQLQIVHSDAGHDGFLLEQEQVGGLIAEFLAKHA